MSYIVAFVSFDASEKEFPVQCYRTDIKVGVDVVVRRQDGKLRVARIHRLEYLNWNCYARIECIKSEAKVNLIP
jgi:hypothetical protein